MKLKTTTSCFLCGNTITLTGKGKWREDIQAFEWYESNHECPKLNGADNALGQLNNLFINQ